MKLSAMLATSCSLAALCLAVCPAAAQTPPTRSIQSLPPLLVPNGGDLFVIQHLGAVPGTGTQSISLDSVTSYINTRLGLVFGLTNEVARAQAAEAAITTALAAETSRAQTAEQANTSAISTEATTARNASNLTGGTVPIGVLPVGTTLGTVAGGADSRIPTPNTTGDQQITGPDGAQLAVVHVLPAPYGAVEALHFLPGNSNAGATLLCQRPTDPTASVNVSCNIVATNEGRIRFAGGDGLYLEITPPGAPVTAVMQINPGTQPYKGVSLSCIPLTGTTCPVQIVPLGSSVSMGITNTVSGYGNVLAGTNGTTYGGTSTAPGGFYSGNYFYDFSTNYGLGVRCHMSTWLSGVSNYAGGGNQVCEQTLGINITGTTAGRFSVDASANYAFGRSIPFQANGHGTFTLEVECSTSAGDSATWRVQGSFTRYGVGLKLPYVSGTDTSLSGSLSAGGLGNTTLSVTADTTNNNLNITATPPSGNSATIACTAYARWMQRLS